LLVAAAVVNGQLAAAVVVDFTPMFSVVLKVVQVELLDLLTQYQLLLTLLQLEQVVPVELLMALTE
jgi:hypothetical protein